MKVSDRIVALYLGRVAADVRAKDVTVSDVVQMITTGSAPGAAAPVNGAATVEAPADASVVVAKGGAA
jgi:D-xylose transport system ATP-binding protein